MDQSKLEEGKSVELTFGRRLVSLCGLLELGLDLDTGGVGCHYWL